MHHKNHSPQNPPSATIAGYTLTNHARKRMQQRCIPKEVVAYILEQGDFNYAHQARYYHCPKNTARHAPPEMRQYLDKKHPPYVVVRDHAILTVGPHNKKWKDNYLPHRRNRRRQP